MALIALPDDAPQDFMISMQDITGYSESPFTFASNVYQWQGQRWAISVTLPLMHREQVAAWIAALAALRGRFNTFLYGDPMGASPRGSAKDTPGSPALREAATARATIVKLSGLPSNATGYLLAGDYIQFGAGSGSRLHVLTRDVDTGASGQGDVHIWPGLRAAIASGSGAVYLSNARGVFRLTSDARDIPRDAQGLFQVAFEANEVV